MLAFLVPGVGMGAAEFVAPVDTRIYDPINRRSTNLAPEVLRAAAAFILAWWTYGR